MVRIGMAFLWVRGRVGEARGAMIQSFSDIISHLQTMRHWPVERNGHAYLAVAR